MGAPPCSIIASLKSESHNLLRSTYPRYHIQRFNKMKSQLLLAALVLGAVVGCTQARTLQQQYSSGTAVSVSGGSGPNGNCGQTSTVGNAQASVLLVCPSNETAIDVKMSLEVVVRWKRWYTFRGGGILSYNGQQGLLSAREARVFLSAVMSNLPLLARYLLTGMWRFGLRVGLR